jgi:hypothetical protein
MSRRNIKSWKGRQARPVELDLPSGAVVEVRRVSLAALMAQGLVPQTFFENTPAKKPSEMTQEERLAFNERTMAHLKNDPTALSDMTQLARHVAKDAVRWPKVVDVVTAEMLSEMEKASESEDPDAVAYIAVDDIPWEDLLTIMNFAIGEAPVQTTSGEVSADALRKTDGDEHLQGDRVDVPDVSPVAQ